MMSPDDDPLSMMIITIPLFDEKFVGDFERPANMTRLYVQLPGTEA